MPNKPSVQSTAPYKVTLSTTSSQKASTNNKTHSSNTGNSGGILGIFSNIKKDISNTAKNIPNKVNNFVNSAVSNLNNTVRTVEKRVSSAAKTLAQNVNQVKSNLDKVAESVKKKTQQFIEQHPTLKTAVSKTEEVIKKAQKTVAQVEEKAKEKLKQVANDVRKKTEEFINNNPKLKATIIKAEKVVKKTAGVITQAKKEAVNNIKIAAEKVKSKVTQFIEKGEKATQNTAAAVKRNVQETIKAVDKTLKSTAHQLVDTGKKVEKYIQQKKEEAVQAINKANLKLQQGVKNTIKSAEEKVKSIAKDIKEGLKKAVDVTTTNSISVEGNKTIKEKKVTLNVAGNKLYLKFTSSVSGELGVEKSYQYKANTKNASGSVEHNNSGKLNMDFEKVKINKNVEVTMDSTLNGRNTFNWSVKADKRGAEITGGAKFVLFKTHNQELNMTVGGTIKSSGEAEINLGEITHSFTAEKITAKNSIGLSIDKENYDKIKKAVSDIIAFNIGVRAGVLKGAVNTVKSVVDVVTHPKQIGEGVKELVKHPQAALNYAKQAVANAKNEFVKGDASKKGEMVGKALFEVGVSVAGTKGLDKLAKAAKVSSNLGKLKKVFDVTTKVSKPAFAH